MQSNHREHNIVTRQTTPSCSQRLRSAHNCYTAMHFSVRHHRQTRLCRSAASCAFSSAVLTSLLSTKMLEALGSTFCLQLAVASLISCLLGFLTLFVSFHWRLHQFRQFPSPTPHWLLGNTDWQRLLLLARQLAGHRGHRYGGRRAPRGSVLVGHAGIRCDGRRPHTAPFSHSRARSLPSGLLAFVPSSVCMHASPLGVLGGGMV
jgi:hypothetical protein